MLTNKPEVLAPAGNAEALSAAIGAGADAVYFGLGDYNARIRARNFDLAELPDLLRDLRRWGVKSYLAFNTLVFSEEMSAARGTLEAIAKAGPDGIIVQDLGVLRLVREVAPDLPVHASTQMTVASADGVRLVAGLGARRVILARELSLPEIARIRATVATELEVFVHGALCVSYSGQCLSSEAWGGRSANRGQCAQACRLPYDLMVDGLHRELGDRAYLLSPRDLEGYLRIPELMDLGISAFKIEGRMKSPEYVAASTALYREAVDRAWERHLQGDAGRSDSGSETGLSPRSTSIESPDRDASPRSDVDRLASEVRQVFSRGASEGFLGGVNHQVLVDGKIRAHRGHQVGVVLRVEPGRDETGRAVVIEAAGGATGEPIRLASGDGLLFAASAREEDEVGGRILSAEESSDGRSVRIRFPRQAAPDFSTIQAGTPVFRTSQPALLDRLRREIGHPEASRQVRLAAHVEGTVGEPLRLRLTDPDGRTISVISSLLLQPAQGRALDAAFLREHFGRLGGTRYGLDGLETNLAQDSFLPVSELNRMRRQAIRELEDLRGRAAIGPPVNGEQGPIVLDDVEDGPSPVIWAVERAVADGEGLESRYGGSTGVEPPVSVGQEIGHGQSAPGQEVDHDQSVLDQETDHDRSASDQEIGNGQSVSSERFEDCVIVLCRDLDQMRGACDAGARHLALDFLDLVGLKEASAELRRMGVRRTLALPRVQKPGEERIESFFLGLEPEEILVRNLGGVERLRRLGDSGIRQRGDAGAAGGQGSNGGEPPFPILVGDVSLNAVNPESIRILLDLGLDRVAPGLDLNGRQIESLVRRIDPARVEIPIHHHLPVFHTEHCVFAAFLSDGADFRTCGRPCDRHRLELRDRTGQLHPVVADVGCRNTVFGGRPQSVLAHLEKLRATGVRRYRIELISQDRRKTSRLVQVHREVWDRKRSAESALRELHAESAYGVSIGSPEPARKRETRPAGSRAKAPGSGLAKSFRPKRGGVG